MSKKNIFALSESQELKGLFDPVEIAQAEQTPMLLLESADIITKLGEKSMLLLDLALKIEARNNHITISASMPEAQSLLDLFAQAFEAFIVERI